MTYVMSVRSSPCKLGSKYFLDIFDILYTWNYNWCNQVTSYGGKLTYTVRFEIPQDTAAEGIVKADVRLEVWISCQLSSAQAFSTFRQRLKNPYLLDFYFWSSITQIVFNFIFWSWFVSFVIIYRKQCDRDLRFGFLISSAQSFSTVNLLWW